MKWEDLTDEQKIQLQQTMIVASKAIIDAFEAMFSSLQPALDTIKKFYDDLPQDVKEEIAALQVEDTMKKANIDAMKSIDPKKHYIALKLDEYSKFWNPEKQIYVVPDPKNAEDTWTPTREELIEDLGKSYDFEHGDQS